MGPINQNVHQPKLNYGVQQFHPQQQPVYETYTPVAGQRQPNTMSQYHMNFRPQAPAQFNFTDQANNQRRGTIRQQQSMVVQENHENFEFQKMGKQRQYGTQRNLFSQAPFGDQQQHQVANLPLKQVQQFYDDAITKSTTMSSAGSNDFQSDEDDLEVTSSCPFDASPVMQKQYSHATPMAGRANASLTPMAKPGKMENGWKKKVKTELCRFWLNG